MGKDRKAARLGERTPQPFKTCLLPKHGRTPMLARPYVKTAPKAAKKMHAGQLMAMPLDPRLLLGTAEAYEYHLRPRISDILAYGSVLLSAK